MALTLAPLAAGCGGGGGKKAEATPTVKVSKNIPLSAIALVGTEQIPKTEFDRLIAQAKKGYETQKREFPQAGTVEYDTLKKQAVQYLVQRAELRQEAQVLGIAATDADVDRRLGELKKQYFGGDQTKFEAAIKDQGLTEDDVRENIRGQVLSEKIFDSVTKGATVTDDELKKYYEENADQFKQTATREVRHILVKTKAKADDLYARIQAGADFSKLAKKFSQDPGSKDQGGKLTVRQGETVAPFDQFAFSAKVGELSKPIETQFGWHIIQALSAVKPESVTPLDQVKESIRQVLLQQKRNEIFTNWLDRLKAKYAPRVTYAVGYAPSVAASSSGGTGSR